MLIKKLSHSRLKIAKLCTLISGVLLMTTSAYSSTVSVRVLETSDLHANMMDFDYYTLKPTTKFGLVRTATLINAAKKENPNTLLIDNGDLIQGSPLGDFYAAKQLNEGEIHPIIEALNYLGYDAATLGNHEFNYGLDYLNRVIKDAKYPVLNANIYDLQTKKPFFTPYVIKPTTFTDDKGDSVTLNVGYIGFVAPKITIWDKQHLEGKVYTEDIILSAKKWVPEMKRVGADIIIAINHSGIDDSTYEAGMENAGYYLTQLQGIDVVLTGHSHDIFPSPSFEISNADLNLGTINGIPVAMPGYFGSHLGVIDLTLEKSSDGWNVIQSKAESRPIYDTKNEQSLAEADPDLLSLLETTHNQTIDFVNQPIGKTAKPIYGYLALVQDSPTLQIINDAQKSYIEKHLAANPELEKLPILSAAAPFKAGGRDGYALSYTAVEEGFLTYRNAADIYLFPNTVTVVKVSGVELKDWLECSAGIFNQIDTTSTEKQQLINYEGFRTYNFDVIDGVNYTIDITKPPRFDGECQLINPDSSRIKALTFDNKPIDSHQNFYIVTNNYRGFGGKFAGTGTDKVAMSLPVENRTVIADYITEKTKSEGEVKVNVDNNWRLAPIETKKALDIRFNAPAEEKVLKYIKENASIELEETEQINNEIQEYRIKL
ncbi:bifunctional 2',3'-cyclic-nucleotide 2'-phosphodiesterase/3'-nucleotidase [Thorsellia kenyensis]|uniref:Bifunctional 2',3'-cyclic-nucleotide 2'-phosphodiesterase/3'-nucleotidase n=1 Tax=Thorsellia kenyensis TaxID=1549888 RepID=A0ABV6CD56_9GAMM